MTSYPRRAALLAASVLLAACGETPTQPAQHRLQASPLTRAATAATERTVEEHVYDLSDIPSFTKIECENGAASELVRLDGKVYVRTVYLTDATGAHHMTHHTMPIGVRGVGETSGEEYRVKQAEHGTYTQRATGATGSFRQTLRLVGRESGRSFLLVSSGHYAINANGDLVVDRSALRLECSE
jgi:hypothetical protein